MFGWLRKRRAPPTLPEYAALRSRPSRKLPDALVAIEASDDQRRRCDAIHEDLLRPPNIPSPDHAFLISFAVLQQGGVLTIPMPDGSQSLPIFSSPIRAADYARTSLRQGPDVQYRVSTATECATMLRDLREAGVASVAFDRCPRCDVLMTFKTSAGMSATDVLTMCAIQKSTQLARAELYYRFACEAARSGGLNVARDVGLEAVGHVSMEDPHLHLLLGKLAKRLHDRRLRSDAEAFLLYLGVENWKEALHQPI